MLRVVTNVLLASALGTAATIASATPIYFDVAGGSATTSGFAVGTSVRIETSRVLESVAFELDGVGQSKTFDFLDIKVGCAGVVAGIIDATLKFSSPIWGNAEGLLAGFGVVLGRGATGGIIPISPADVVSFGNGGLFAVSFSGFGESCLHCKLEGTIQATVTLLKAPTTSVPEPGTLSLLGAGLIAAALSRRRKRI